MIQLCHQIIHYDLGRTYYKQSISEKIKTVDNRIKQNKVQYDLNKQAAKISALPSINISKFDFLTGKDGLPEKDLPEKAAALKRFKYSTLGKELKTQRTAAVKKVSRFLSQIKKEKQIIKKYNK